MKVAFKDDIASLQASFSAFIDLVGLNRWTRRIDHLRREAGVSPFRAKLAFDNHWLELELADFGTHMSAGMSTAHARPNLDCLASLYFAQTVVEAHRRLPSAGKAAIEGRLNSALKSETGFSSLYLEMAIARTLFDAGCDVEFDDMEGLARYDLRFLKGAVEGEVECKSISADAGRKIHRRDFYRFVDTIGAPIAKRAAAGAHELLVVTVDDRMPSDDTQQGALRSALTCLLSDSALGHVAGSFFSVEREQLALRLGGFAAEPADLLYQRCRQAHGDACHVSGAFTYNGACLIVVKSRREDDHSAPQLEALKKAASQFSTSRPAFIAIQYDDITPKDLVLPHLRRQAAILSYYLFLESQASHVMGTYFCVYGGLSVSEHGIGAPAFGVPNPRPRFTVRRDDYPTFFGHIPDAELTRIVGAPPPIDSISFIPLDSLQGKNPERSGLT